MKEIGNKNPEANLADLGLADIATANWNLSPEELQEKTLELKQGVLADTGALVVDTGEFTGRAPQDRYIVKDSVTENTVDWNNINQPIGADKFDILYERVKTYLAGKEVYVRDASVCADPTYQMNIRVITEYPWASLFAYNMFLKPTAEEVTKMTPEWTILSAPGCTANAETDGTRQHNFAIINFTKKMILIGGTAYTGEIKKGVFSVLNYMLPHEKKVLSMHCSANIGEKGDTAIFFGLSGTGKTTLSADPGRRLIGDDEHGWADSSVFNFEGGCYAKCINLSPEGEPQIYSAIRPGAILENIRFYENTNKVNFEDSTVTENTRVSYPIHFIDNVVDPSRGDVPKNIFFLTCDAFGVLPPISKLSAGQAMYQFISGYTAKVAGTEAGITEPQTTFSACFGAPFLPLHPTKYAELLGEKIKSSNASVWLVNTGWTGGPYGVGSRMQLSLTRAMITAALKGQLDDVTFEKHPVFGLEVPQVCAGVPTEVLNARDTWSDKEAYDVKANELAKAFVQNFEKYASEANEEIMKAAPNLAMGV